jgi:di/tricarboxylate transporter
MGFEIGLLFAIIVIALLLFSLDRFSPDVVALGVMLSLIVTGMLTPAQAFAGFGSDTFLMILGLLILSAALTRTGVVDLLGAYLFRWTGDSPGRTLLMVMVASATLSAFMSNTASTAFFLPAVFGMAVRSKISASKLLMPLAFASILTSSVTLVSTSTNIVVSGLIQQYGYAPMGMFELSPVGVPIALVGIVYMYFIGRRLIPDRGTPHDAIEEFGLRPYLTEVMILPESPLAGKTLGQAGLGDLGLTVLRIVRDKDQYLAPRAEATLEVGDVLLVEGTSDEILKVKDKAGIDIKADVKLSDPDLETEDMRLVEVILLPGSPLIGRTLKSFRFRERFGLQVLAMTRNGGISHRKISQIQLRMGDMLLVQGHRAHIAALEDDKTFRVLGAVESVRPHVGRAPIAIGIFVVALALATFKVVPLPVAVLLGALAAFVTRCITPDEAYREIDWKVLILIGCMLALGVAMEKTGAEKLLAQGIIGLVGTAGPTWLLTGFFVLTVILTQPMSNQAAAVVVVPVAIQTAVELGLNPRTFAMMIAVAASCSYLTPLEPACLMVYGPGRYRFSDFLKVGSLLTIVIYVIAILLVPVVWPLQP